MNKYILTITNPEINFAHEYSVLSERSMDEMRETFNATVDCEGFAAFKTPSEVILLFPSTFLRKCIATIYQVKNEA